nr:CoA transferase [Azospirillum sp. INR13]
MQLVASADALIEGYRPGVAEKLGFGPEACHARNPRLVYGRMTGWGQSGPLALTAGHDLNYIALTGALHAMGEANRPPTPPLNLVGDYGGGGMLLALGILSAVIVAGRTGQGQVVDAAMVDGSALLMSAIYGLRAKGFWSDVRENNMLDGGAPFYACYECADGAYISVAAIEPQFYKQLLQRCEITDLIFSRQWDRALWPVMKEKLAALFRVANAGRMVRAAGRQ